MISCERLMEEITISKFKATCLAVLERVRKTGKPIRITRFGQVLAEVVPPGEARPAPRLGTGMGTGVILGDIVGPIGDESD
jgi:antitoxin (DNA-binding transcriptional repressor) of toxin-antitoxin stability system